MVLQNIDVNMSTRAVVSDSVEQDNSLLTYRAPAQVCINDAGPSISSLRISDVLIGKASYAHIPFLRRLYFMIRALFVFFMAEFPLLWGWLFQGGRNDRADVEGPFYISGAPDLQVADGKAIIASREDMEANPTYLLTVRVCTPSGKPVPFATLDFWQATSTGWYYNSRYRLRGICKTDEEGVCEILTVIPGAYGFGEAKGGGEPRLLRAGHFHIRISPPADGVGKDLELLTTQVYVCRKNDTQDMSSDFVNYLRAVREQNMIHSWATPSFYAPLSSTAYSAFAVKYSFPAIPPTSLKPVGWWNNVLAERFPGSEQLRVLAGGETTIKLNKQPRFYWF